MLTPELVASYYAYSLANLLKVWIKGDLQEYDADDMVEAYEYLLTHNLTDYVNLDKNRTGEKS